MNISKTLQTCQKMLYFGRKTTFQAIAQKSKCAYTHTIDSNDISNDHTLPLVKNDAKIL